MPGMEDLAPLTWRAFWTTWELRPVWTLVAVGLLAAYVAGLRAARRHGRRGTHPTRVASFVLGLVTLLWTVSSAVDAYAMTRFWMHMTEHLLLIMVVPMLLVLGHPLEVTRNALGERGRTRFDEVMHSAPVSVLTHPVVTFGLYTVVIVGTHLTTFMDQMVTTPWLMQGEQVLYLVSGYLFWLALIGGEPIRWRLPVLARILMVLIGMSPDTVVGIVLMQATSLQIPGFMAARPPDALDALRDQYVGGSVMWFFGDGIMMVAGIVLLVDLLAHPQQNATLGTWLESARRAQLDEHVRRTGGEQLAQTSDGDDDAALEAYNAMLARLSRREG